MRRGGYGIETACRQPLLFSCRIIVLPSFLLISALGPPTDTSRKFQFVLWLHIQQIYAPPRIITPLSNGIQACDLRLIDISGAGIDIVGYTAWAIRTQIKIFG